MKTNTCFCLFQIVTNIVNNKIKTLGKIDKIKTKILKKILKQSSVFTGQVIKLYTKQVLY